MRPGEARVEMAAAAVTVAGIGHGVSRLLRAEGIFQRGKAICLAPLLPNILRPARAAKGQRSIFIVQARPKWPALPCR